MKDKMNKKEIEKIEYQLSDTEVPDSVLNLARAEISKSQKPALRKLNFKIALSCAASFVLCLAIILPVTLSSFNKNGGSAQPPDSSADSRPSSPDDSENNTPAPDITSPGDASSGATPFYSLQELDNVQVYPAIGDSELQPPTGVGAAINYLSHTKYYAYGVEIISQEIYSVYGAECTVYTQYSLDFGIKELDIFKNYENQYSYGTANVDYKIADGNYLAEAYYDDYRYCFTGNFENNSIFEEFCRYLFQEN